MPTQSRARNSLELPLAEFKRATKVFRSKRVKLGPALLAFESSFLSIESGEVTTVMRACGEWHGRATFSAEALRAISMVPPSCDPVIISYAEGHLLVGNMTLNCGWQSVSADLIYDLENPALLDLLVLGRTLTRAEMKGSELGRKIVRASQQAEKRIQKAVAQLTDLGVDESELRALVETKITARLD